ncbi:hypothetical protein RI367_001592 [Sorochytrium milnesiophthora]
MPGSVVRIRLSDGSVAEFRRQADDGSDDEMPLSVLVDFVCAREPSTAFQLMTTQPPRQTLATVTEDGGPCVEQSGTCYALGLFGAVVQVVPQQAQGPRRGVIRRFHKRGRKQQAQPASPPPQHGPSLDPEQEQERRERAVAAIQGRQAQQKESPERTASTPARDVPSLRVWALAAFIPTLASPTATRAQIMPIRFLSPRLADTLLELSIKYRRLDMLMAKRLALCGFENMDLSGYAGPAASMLGALAQSKLGATHTAKRLSLRPRCADHDGGTTLVSSIVLGGFENLRMLTLAGCGLTDLALSQWQRASSTSFLPRLEHLDLSGNGITCATLGVLAALLAPHQQLVELNVSACPNVFADKVLDACAPLADCLRTLSITGCKTCAPVFGHSADVCTPVQQCLLHNHHAFIGPLRMSTKELGELPVFRQLTDINASRSALGNNAIPLLVARVPNLVRLQLHETDVSMVVAPFIARLDKLRYFTFAPTADNTRQVLTWLNHLPLGELVVGWAANTVVDFDLVRLSSLALPPCPMGLSIISSPAHPESPVSVQSLALQASSNRLDYSAFVTDAAETNTSGLVSTLTSLKVIAPSADFTQLAWLQAFSGITHLTLAGTGVGDLVLQHVIHLPLAYLDLSYCAITNAGACVLAGLLQASNLEPFSSSRAPRQTSPHKRARSNSFDRTDLDVYRLQATLQSLILDRTAVDARYAYVVASRCRHLTLLSVMCDLPFYTAGLEPQRQERPPPEGGFVLSDHIPQQPVVRPLPSAALDLLTGQLLYRTKSFATGQVDAMQVDDDIDIDDGVELELFPSPVDRGPSSLAQASPAVRAAAVTRLSAWMKQRGVTFRAPHMSVPTSQRFTGGVFPVNDV